MQSTRAAETGRNVAVGLLQRQLHSDGQGSVYDIPSSQMHSEIFHFGLLIPHVCRQTYSSGKEGASILGGEFFNSEAAGIPLSQLRKLSCQWLEEL